MLASRQEVKEATKTNSDPGRAQLAKGVFKALFTTSPRKPTEVVVTEDGSVEVTALPEQAGAAEAEGIAEAGAGNQSEDA